MYGNRETVGAKSGVCKGVLTIENLFCIKDNFYIFLHKNENMKTLSLTINEQTKEGYSLLTFLKSLDFVSLHENEDIVFSSGKQAAVECNAVSLDSFIFELHRKVDNHFATKNNETR